MNCETCERVKEEISVVQRYLAMAPEAKVSRENMVHFLNVLMAKFDEPPTIAVPLLEDA